MFDPEDAMAKVMRFNPPPPFLSFHTHTQTHLPPATPHAPPLCPPAMQPAMSLRTMLLYWSVSMATAWKHLPPFTLCEYSGGKIYALYATTLARKVPHTRSTGAV